MYVVAVCVPGTKDATIQAEARAFAIALIAISVGGVGIDENAASTQGARDTLARRAPRGVLLVEKKPLVVTPLRTCELLVAPRVPKTANRGYSSSAHPWRAQALGLCP